MRPWRAHGTACHADGSARPGVGGYLVAQFDQRLEEPGIGRIDIVVRTAHLHDPGLCRGRQRLAAERPTRVSTRRRPPSRMRSAAGVTWPPPASSVLMCLTPARAAAAVSVWSPKAASTR